MDKKLEEDVNINISDSQKSKISSRTYQVQIDDKGNGSVTTEEFNNYLEAVILPPHMSIFNVKIKSNLFPEWQIFNFNRENESLRVLPIRMLVNDYNGGRTDIFAKIPLLGSYNIMISQAVPNSQLNISLIFGES